MIEGNVKFKVFCISLECTLSLYSAKMYCNVDKRERISLILWKPKQTSSPDILNI